jgi:magnesium chelatase family protein
MTAAMFFGAVPVGIGSRVVPVTCETTHAGSLGGCFEIRGVPDAAAREIRIRVRSALLSSFGVSLDDRRVIVSIDADAPRFSGLLDLPIAVAVLATTQMIPNVLDALLVGELSLTGELRPVRGATPIAYHTKQANLVVPRENGAEAAEAWGSRPIQTGGAFTATRLAEVVGFLLGKEELPRASTSSRERANEVDFSDVAGHWAARRALEIAAAGSHDVLLVGSPGPVSGRTMLARRLPTILPTLSAAERYEVSAVHSVAGLSIPKARPFRAPHYTVSEAGLVGSHGRPGEASLAHGGVLFLDEIEEYRRSALGDLHEALSRGTVGAGFPANPIVVAAGNPCPCGYEGDEIARCACSLDRIARWRERRKGAFFDRFAIRVLLGRPQGERGDSSSTILARVEKARAFRAEMDAAAPVRLPMWLDESAERFVTNARKKGVVVSHAMVGVARTIADLAGKEEISEPHVAEALQLATGVP